MRAYVRACVRACMRACVYVGVFKKYSKPNLTGETGYLPAAQLQASNIALASHIINYTNLCAVASKRFVTRTLRTAQSLNVVHCASGI